jgi:hypothetical protein
LYQVILTLLVIFIFCMSHSNLKFSFEAALPPQGCASRMGFHGDMVREITFCTTWTGLSLAEAGFGAAIVLPNEFFAN